MITSKKLRLLLGALCVTGGLMVASAQPAVHPKSYYDEITYEWTDASNVTHTSAITEEATDPYQMVALLKKVYCDPRLPGPTYTAYTQNGTRENEVYYGKQAGGWNISNSDVTKPYEDGYTMLMVSVDNNSTATPSDDGEMFNSTTKLVNYFRDNVTSIQLLTDGMRIGEGERAGTVFNISGYYNRFFMISKGQSRQKSSSNSSPYGEEPPFKQMYEELSPTNGKPGSDIDGFYTKMIDGEDYPVIHDCVSVISESHFFSMAGKDGKEYKSLTGLNIFMPDYRLKYFKESGHDGRTMNYGDWPDTWVATYAKYNPDYAPDVRLYTIKLTATPVKADEPYTYNVNLTWTSSLDEMAHGTVPQTYTVYVVEPGPDGAPTYRKIGETNETHFTDVVPQDEFSTTYTYIIYGQPADENYSMFNAWSNDVMVFIPGWHDFVELHVGHFESDYFMEQERNYYRNFLNIANADPENGLTLDRLTDENSFTLYRVDLSDENMPETAVLDLKLTRNNNSVRYNITYADNTQTPTPGYNVNVTNSGNLSVGDGGLINLGAITLIDQFYASTVNDQHPTIYGYVLKLNSSTLDKKSNTATVYVMKSSSAPKGYYTLDQVMNDVDGTLQTNVKSGDLTMNLINLPDVYHYTIDRGNGTQPNEEVLSLQRNTDGTFEDMATSSNYPSGTFWYNDPMAVGTDYMTYVPIIWLRGDDRVAHDGKENSYGGPIWKTGVGNIEAMVGGTRATGQFGEFVDFDLEKCAIYNPIFDIKGLVPANTNIEYEPFMYRVWRNCNDVRPYFYSSEGKPLFWPYSTPESHALIVERMTTEDHIAAGNEFDELAFGAKLNTTIEFVVRFYYKVVGANFTRDLNDNDELYYVVEARLPWNNIPTGVAEINNANTEVSKTYYNAQGVKSDKPFDGVNIVITRYSDGSTKTTKVIR